MWKMVLVLLATALFILIAQLVFDPPHRCASARPKCPR
jgi:hypothetical protein